MFISKRLLERQEQQEEGREQEVVCISKRLLERKGQLAFACTGILFFTSYISLRKTMTEAKVESPHQKKEGLGGCRVTVTSFNDLQRFLFTPPHMVPPLLPLHPRVISSSQWSGGLAWRAWRRLLGLRAYAGATRQRVGP